MVTIIRNAHVHRYRAKTSQIVDVSATFSPSRDSVDGVHLIIRLNDDVLVTRLLTGSYQFERSALVLAPGDVLEFSVGPNSNATGDVTDYRITVRRAGGRNSGKNIQIDAESQKNRSDHVYLMPKSDFQMRAISDAD